MRQPDPNATDPCPATLTESHVRAARLQLGRIDLAQRAHSDYINDQLGVKGHDDGQNTNRRGFSSAVRSICTGTRHTECTFQRRSRDSGRRGRTICGQLRGGRGRGTAVRFAHAKGYGLVRAEVEILDELPSAYAQGIYATPGRHDALIRFSNGVAHLGPDAFLSNAFGLALKMFDVEGPALVDDEPDAGTFDYNTINMPVFFCNTVAHYLFIQQLFTDAASYL